jgi:hypothetical protein
MAGLYEVKATAFHLRQLAEASCRNPGDLRAEAEAFLPVFAQSGHKWKKPRKRTIELSDGWQKGLAVFSVR